ncbi:MAG TPA: SDR family oxidoreductase [Burkholderiales bacterium]
MLRDKIAWVTGAGTGIGLAGATALAAAGAVVVMSGRRADVLEKAAATIQERGGKVEVEALDVSDAQAVDRVAEVIAARHGSVNVLVNSAGLNVTKRFFSEQTVEGWDQVVRVNLDGTYYCVRAVLPLMRAQKDGVIINISSWAGIHTSMVTGPAYNASKHAVVSLTENLNMEECVNGIRACAICPAEVATAIMDRRPMPPTPEERARMLQPQDLGNAIRWVAEQPPHVCVNEIVISPTWNRLFVGQRA